MSETENLLTPQESLLLITQAIGQARQNIRENSFCFLLWGWLIATASFSTWLIHQYASFSFYFLPFPLLSAIGIITTFSYYRKKRMQTSLSYISDFLGKMWMVLAISFVIVVFISVSKHTVPFTYTLLIAGIGTLASGLTMKFKPLILGGILFFAAALVSVYMKDDYKVLLQGVAVVVSYLVPGYLLKSDKS